MLFNDLLKRRKWIQLNGFERMHFGCIICDHNPCLPKLMVHFDDDKLFIERDSEREMLKGHLNLTKNLSLNSTLSNSNDAQNQHIKYNCDDKLAATTNNESNISSCYITKIYQHIKSAQRRLSQKLLVKCKQVKEKASSTNCHSNERLSLWFILLLFLLRKPPPKQLIQMPFKKNSKILSLSSNCQLSSSSSSLILLIALLLSSISLSMLFELSKSVSISIIFCKKYINYLIYSSSLNDDKLIIII